MRFSQQVHVPNGQWWRQTPCHNRCEAQPAKTNIVSTFGSSYNPAVGGVVTRLFADDTTATPLTSDWLTRRPSWPPKPLTFRDGLDHFRQVQIKPGLGGFVQHNGLHALSTTGIGALLSGGFQVWADSFQCLSPSDQFRRAVLAMAWSLPVTATAMLSGTGVVAVWGAGAMVSTGTSVATGLITDGILGSVREFTLQRQVTPK